jgi:hypothetical protein
LHYSLCNACGLHYAKSLKKQRKEREGRKHSIEMLLNVSGVVVYSICGLQGRANSFFFRRTPKQLPKRMVQQLRQQITQPLKLLRCE